jgi:predicted acetyltransferase
MPELIVPTVRLHRAWLEAHAEWGPGFHEDGFGLTATDDVLSRAGFAAWVARLTGESHLVTCRWIVESDRVLGGIALRQEPDEQVQRAGHVGFGIRPSARRRGLATGALGRMLDEAGLRGMDRVLSVCATDNAASAKTIERLGGVLAEVRHTRIWSRSTLLDSDPRIGYVRSLARVGATGVWHRRRDRPRAPTGLDDPRP